jgi:O-antigen/teichoic acid export membrane protein
LLVFKPSATAAMIAVMLGLFGGIAISLWALRDRLVFETVKTRRFPNIGAALSLGLRGQLGNVATFFNYRLDVFIVNYYLNTAEVGIYALGVIISEALWQLPNAAAAALLPRTARTLDKSDPAFTCLVCRQVFALACVSGCTIGALSPWLIPMIFGSKFAPSVAVIWWILPGTIALASAKVMSADLLARGMPEYAAIFAFVTLIVTVILDLALIPRMGIQGAALASSLAYLVNAVLVASVLKQKLGVTWRALYIPSIAELAPYGQIWSRLVSRLRPSAVA